MNSGPRSQRPTPHRPAILALATLIALPLSLLANTPTADTPSPQPSVQAKAETATPVSLADYRGHLLLLDQVIAACQPAPSPATCHSNQVGPDIQVALPSGPRQIRYGWLRDLLDYAAKEPERKDQEAKDKEARDKAAKDQAAKDQAAKDHAAKDQAAGSQKSPTPDPGRTTTLKLLPEFTPPSLATRLTDARKRLTQDGAMATQILNPAGQSPQPTAAQHQTLDHILAAKEYHVAVAPPTIGQRILEKVANWLNDAISSLIRAGSKSKWIGAAAEIGFIVLLCVALVWFLIRIERQGRLLPAMLRPGSGTGAASARDWQLWLADAREAAARGAWRDAIHLLYWASISRLESSGLWPADRARTPREYLALLKPESAQRSDLAALTGSFERTWYAGRAAAESDYRQAEQLAANLGAR